MRAKDRELSQQLKRRSILMQSAQDHRNLELSGMGNIDEIQKLKSVNRFGASRNEGRISGTVI